MSRTPIRIRRSAAVLALCLAVVAGGLLTAGFKSIRGHGTATDAVTFAVAPAALAADGRVSWAEGFAPVVEPALESVVNVSSSKTIKSSGSSPGSPFFNDPFFQQFFGRQFQEPRERRERSLGSGVIVSSDGHILTNNHVVDGATDVKVSLRDHREFSAKIVGTDPKTDVAVLKIDATGLRPLTLGDSSKTRIGQFALAIGDPFGIGETVTMGIVSAKGRGGLSIEDYEDFIQTDAAINPGNSGGALINTEGELIGINTAILTRGGGGNEGVGFAIPINMARGVMQQILTNGKVVRGYLGLLIQPMSPALAKAFGISVTNGALVGDVTNDGPAGRAGVRKGDVIVAMNGEPVKNSRDLRLRVAETPPGTEVRLKIIRDGKTQEIAVKLGELPEKAQAASAEGGENETLSGVRVEALTPQIARQLRLNPATQGVVVDDVAESSAAADAGLRRGDVIEQVDRKPVTSAAAFEHAAREAGQNPVLLLVNRQGNTSFVLIQPQ